MRQKHFLVILFIYSVLLLHLYYQLRKSHQLLLKSKETKNFIKQYLNNLVDDKENIDSNIEFLQKVIDGNIQTRNYASRICNSDLVCNEKYLGNLADLPWHQHAWVIEDCSKRVSDILTVILIEDENSEKVIRKIQKQYPKLQIILGVFENYIDYYPIVTTVKISKSARQNHWANLIKRASTEFVFIGINITDWTTNWGNFERAIRIINDSSQIGAVSGATKNASGHWKSHCWQAKRNAYNLILTPGYLRSSCDCQICSFLGDGLPPFIATKINLNHHLDGSITSTETMFTDFFLRLEISGKSVLSCPDLMFQVGQDFDFNINWSRIATKWKLLGISINFGPRKFLELDCSKIGLECNPGDQTQSLLVPWCCMYAAHHIVKVMNQIVLETGVLFELDSGSLLGAVKLNNFIPWDVDGDIYVRTDDLNHFHTGGLGRFILEKEGIEIYGWNQDNYWDKGAGHYQLRYKGVEFELMGKRGNLTLGQLPTLVQFGDTWAPGHDHPGQYLRGRYGPNYLRHAQSWLFVESMETAFDSYSSKSGSWTPCKDPMNQACLDKYPTDGNILWLPHRYP